MSVSGRQITIAIAPTIFLLFALYTTVHFEPATAQDTSTPRNESILQNQIVIANVTESEDPGGRPLPQLIITLKDDTGSDRSEAESFSDSLDSIVTKIERQGIPATINDTFPIFDQAAINIEAPPEANVSDVLTGYKIDITNNTQRQEAAINQSINILEQDPRVESVSQNFEQTAHQGQIIPTGVNRTDADLSVPPARSGDHQDSVDADIAILDCGVDPHEDINLLQDREVSSVLGSTPRDGSGHGTHVAGIAAAKDNDIGVVGTAPGARIWNVKVLDYNPGRDTCTTDTLTIIRGLQYVAEHADEIEVVNLSLGGKCETTLVRCLDPNYENAINDLTNRGVVVVASAGNSNEPASRFVPARFQDVITVSNVVDSDGVCGGEGKPTHRGPDDTLASNSNYGHVVDVAAPGVNILSTYLNNTYARLSGTSMAAPHVTGEAAYYISINPLASPSDVRNAIIETGAGLTTICDGHGFGYFKADRDMYPEPLANIRNITTTTGIP